MKFDVITITNLGKDIRLIPRWKKLSIINSADAVRMTR